VPALSVRARCQQGPERQAGRKTPDESLQNQLDVLHGRLRKVLELAAADEVRKLANHETFINSKR
jgi:hypothetical protein